MSAPEGPVRRAVRVEGRVQGVGFRWFTCRAAERHGVSGWVRNDADGAVSAEVQGAAADVAALLDELRRGPQGARVARLDERALPAQAGERGFHVRRG